MDDINVVEGSKIAIQTTATSVWAIRSHNMREIPKVLFLP